MPLQKLPGVVSHEKRRPEKEALAILFQNVADVDGQHKRPP